MSSCPIAWLLFYSKKYAIFKMVFSNGDVPDDFGVSGISCYFPATYVRQSELEKAQGIAKGKYTIGLGQTEMAFCSDKEDPVSLALTVTRMLLDEYEIDPSSVGYLAVASETLIDKSKSIKSALMQLFDGNTDISGVDVKHACFGGTQALFDALGYLYRTYSKQHRLAIVVCTDIAVYADGPARCTGGAGAVALLLSPGAPLVFDNCLESVDGHHGYDFFKPVGAHNCEYPIVAGKESIAAYLGSLAACYKLYKKKSKEIEGRDTVSLSDFDAACFHSPFTKLVRKAVAVLVAEDARNGDRVRGSAEMEGLVEELRHERAPSDFSQISNEAMKASEQTWMEMTSPNLEMNRRLGNMYTPSLYVQLVGYLSRMEPGKADKTDTTRDGGERRILMYSYGSGSMGAVFSFTAKGRSTERLLRMIEVSRSIIDRLDSRQERTPDEYTEAMAQRERLYTSNVPVAPASLASASLYPVFPETFYLEFIDEKFRRQYAT